MAKVKNTPEATLTTIANIILWVNIILCVILAIVAIAIAEDTGDESVLLLLLAIPLLLFVPLLFWAFARVFVNISNTLKEINQKTTNIQKTTSIICPNCQSPVDTDAKLCTGCGKDFYYIYLYR